MVLPTEPAAYWDPDSSLTHVYYLRRNGEWFHGTYGITLRVEDVPENVRLLGYYRDRDIEGE